MPAIQKLCHLCGDDVADKKRVKDPSGQYFCEPCYAKRRKSPAAALPVSAAAAPAPAPAPPPLPTDDGMLDLAPVREHAKETPMLGCATCKKLLPEKQIRNLDGEFICTACFSRRNAGQRSAIPKPKTSAAPAAADIDDDHSEQFSQSLHGGLLISAAVLVLSALLLFALNFFMPEKGRGGLFNAGVITAIMLVILICRAFAMLLSMVVAGKIMGGISFGYIGPALYKTLSIFLVFMVLDFFADRYESLSMIAYGFRGLFFVLSFIVLFKIDFFEAIILAVANMVVGFLLVIFMGILMVILLGAVSGSHSLPDDEPEPPGIVAPADGGAGGGGGQIP